MVLMAEWTGYVDGYRVLNEIIDTIGY
jgi:hypothetical protein